MLLAELPGGDASSDDDTVLPLQRPTTSRQVISLAEDYGFLPRELRLIVDAGPGCGGVTWPAAQVLTRYCSQHLDLFRGTNIVELGSGTGVVSIALALCAIPETRFWATDIDGLVPLIQENIKLNGVEDCVRVDTLSWGELIPDFIPLRPDVVLLADCVYFEPGFPLLVQTLLDLTTGVKQPEILFCYKRRRKADKKFFALLRKHFIYVEIADDPARGAYSRESIFLYRVSRKRVVF